MTLQSSGAISLANVQTEFGGSNPIGINEYYGVASGVPASGTISLNDFYGKSAAAVANPLFWTYLMFGFRNTNTTTISSETFTGNTITPGAANGPKTFEVNVFRSRVSPYGSSILRYYQGGALNTTWEILSSSVAVNGLVQYPSFNFGASSMRFDSFISDPTTWNDVDGLIYVFEPQYYLDNYGYFGNQTVFYHQLNLTGGGILYTDADVDWDN